MEIGFIPNRLVEIQEDLKLYTTDYYSDSVRFDHNIPLRGIWMKGEFAPERWGGVEIITKGGERLQKCFIDKDRNYECSGR